MSTVTLERRVYALEEKMKSMDTASAARAKLRQMILDGLNSGPCTPMDEAFWKKIRAHAQKRPQS